jgi:hypothetical protein
MEAGLLDVKLAANTRETFSIMAVSCSPSTWEVGEGLKIPHPEIGNVNKFYTRI